MLTFAIAVGSLVLYLLAYHTYGRWLARRFFKLDPNAPVPSRELSDGHDYVPTRKEVLFGHHFTSIAGTGPIVGPALAVIWGWLPALLWVLLGSIFMGAVHDMGALVVSIRNRGQTIGEIAGRLINPRVKVLFLVILFLALTIVLAIFGLVIANIFDMYSSSVFSVWIAMPVAVVVGWLVYKKGYRPHLPALVALGIMVGAIVLAGEFKIFDFTIPPLTLGSFTVSPVVSWTLLLLVYCYCASTLPVWMLLQPRDYINSYLLVFGLALLVLGIGAATFFTPGGAPMVAPAVQTHVPGAPPIVPFLFVTIACGAISGFHCLVSSGTSSKQIARETDAQFVGYGSMLTEGFLAVLVILACCAGIGMGSAAIPSLESRTLGSLSHGNPDTIFTGFAIDEASFNPSKAQSPGVLFIYARAGLPGWSYLDVFRVQPEELADISLNFNRLMQEAKWRPTATQLAASNLAPFGAKIERINRGESFQFANGTIVLDKQGGLQVEGLPAWLARYDSWASAGGLARTVSAFVDGAGNFAAALGIPRPVAVAFMAVLVASFAATTMDTATRLQRYVIQELATTCRVAPLTNKHGATLFAVATAALVAAVPPPGSSWATGMGKGGLILWPLFGAVNQLMAGLAFMVIAFYLARRKMPTWFIAIPGAFMLLIPLAAMLWQLGVWNPEGWWQKGEWHLVGFALAILALQAWMVAEGLRLWPKIRGVLEAQLPPLRRGLAVIPVSPEPNSISSNSATK